MNLKRKIITHLLLVTFSFGNVFAIGTEEDISVLHSLDELPSIHLAESIVESEEITPIHLSKTMETLGNDEGDLISLVAARHSYEAVTTGKAPELAPPTLALLINSPYQTNPLQQDLLLQNLREDILTSLFIGEDVADSLTGKTGKILKTDKKTRLNKKIAEFRGNIQAELEKDTEIQTVHGETLSGDDIGVYEVSSEIAEKGDAYHEKKRSKVFNKKKGRGELTAQTFEFGIPGEHLVFSKPVKISIDTPSMTDGAEMEIAVLHAGDTDFNTGGLSTSPDALCNTDGGTNLPGNMAGVSGGKVTFYTCGASSFTMNPTGGTTGSNDLRLVIGDCGQFQLYYNSGSQMYTGNPPATGCNATLDSWIALRIGGTTYGSDWSNWTTNTMTGSSNGNTYTGRTTLTRNVTGRTYTLILDWRYIAPNKFFNIDWSVNLPVGNTNNVRFYIGNDSTVGGADANDIGYTGSAPSNTVGIFDSVLNQMSAIRYLSGVAWTAQEAGPYANINTRITNGTDFNNTIQTTPADLGFGINWNFGTGANVTFTGAIEWRMVPYSTGSIVDLVPGIGSPEGPLTVNYLSQIPITITNVGSLTSSGVHTTMLYIPTNITGPASSFSDNGWSCGAQVGTGVTCTKTTTLASFGTDTLRIPVTPTLAASGTTVTFTGTITNSGDLVVSNNSAFASNSVAAGLATNPGGVGSPTLWLRADNGTNCTTSGCTITTWNNNGSAGTGGNAITGSGTVIYSSGRLINGNPTIYFNNASLNTTSTLSVTAAFSLFSITSIGTNGKFPVGTQTGVTNAFEWNTTPTYDSWKLWGGATSYTGANGRTASIPALTDTVRSATGLTQDRTNGFQYQTGTLATAIAASRIRIGGTATTSGSLAHVGEVIIYNTALTGTNLNKVQSYLATKYGIPLSQAVVTNYTLSNNSIGMNGTTMVGYLNNIAGIARDDNSALTQESSKSITNSGDIQVAVNSIGTNYSALYWGNNGAATGTLVTTDIATGSVRITREWRFEENNADMGTVTVSYASGALPTGFSGTLMLYTDTDGIFASGATYYTGTFNSTGSTWDFSLDIEDGDYVTFGKNPPTDITPPVISSNSVASGSLLPIGNFALTIGYFDTGSSINTGSFSGQIYSWNTGSSTWNVVNLAPTYMTLSGAATSSTGILRVAGLPYGKYRFDIIIADSVGNTVTQSYTYFVDGINWTIDSDLYNIGDIASNVTKFGTGELVITIQTVGAGFTLTTAPITNFVSTVGNTINYWNGTLGWGYDAWNGFAYSGTITSHSPNATLATQVANINQSGQKNTYTYRIKYGALVNGMQSADNYTSTVRFSLNLTY